MLLLFGFFFCFLLLFFFFFFVAYGNRYHDALKAAVDELRRALLVLCAPALKPDDDDDDSDDSDDDSDSGASFASRENDAVKPDPRGRL